MRTVDHGRGRSDQQLGLTLDLEQAPESEDEGEIELTLGLPSYNPMKKPKNVPAHDSGPGRSFSSSSTASTHAMGTFSDLSPHTRMELALHTLVALPTPRETASSLRSSHCIAITASSDIYYTRLQFPSRARHSSVDDARRFPFWARHRYSSRSNRELAVSEHRFSNGGEEDEEDDAFGSDLDPSSLSGAAVAFPGSDKGGGDDEDGETTTLALLSLSEKPERSAAVVVEEDDMGEFDTSVTKPNHRSATPGHPVA